MSGKYTLRRIKQPESICSGCTERHDNCRAGCEKLAVEKIMGVLQHAQAQKRMQLIEDLHCLDRDRSRRFEGSNSTIMKRTRNE